MTTQTDVSKTHRRRLATRLVLSVAGGLVLIGLAFGIRWWTHPATFSPGDGTIIAPTLPGSATAFGLTYAVKASMSQTVHLRGIHARVLSNTADSTLSYKVCRLSPGEEPVGAVGSLQRFCSDLRPFTVGDTMRLGGRTGGDYLIVVVKPRRLGRTHVEGVDVEYSRGWSHLHQEGWQLLPMDLTLISRYARAHDTLAPEHPTSIDISSIPLDGPDLRTRTATVTDRATMAQISRAFDMLPLAPATTSKGPCASPAGIVYRYALTFHSAHHTLAVSAGQPLCNVGMSLVRDGVQEPRRLAPTDVLDELLRRDMAAS